MTISDPKPSGLVVLPAQRRERIVALCGHSRFASVRDLAKAVGASVPTVQRDLVELDRRGLLHRVRGGAMAVAASALPVPVAERSRQQIDAKRQIGRLTAEKLRRPGLIFLGSGTTVLCIVDHIDAALHRRSQFVTNAYAVARRLAELDLSHLLLPGRLITAVEATVGEHAVAMLERFTFDHAVLGFQGIDAAEGLTDADAAEALLKARAIARARHVMGVIDASKWGCVAPARVADVRNLSCLISDKLPRQAIAQLKKLGVQLLPTDSR